MRSFFTIFSLFLAGMLTAAGGYEIKVEIEGFEEKEAYLGYHYGDKQYIKDTTSVEGGKFVFKGEEDLDGGMYLIVLPPNQEVIQVIINNGDQHFSVKSKMGALTEALEITGSKDNKLFNDYTKYLNREMRPKAEALNKEITAAKEAGDDKKLQELEAKMEKINEDVLDYQKNLIKKNPNSITAGVVRANLTPEDPKFTGEDAEMKRWQYTKRHFFDNLDLSDDRLLRSPVAFGKVDYFMNKLTVQMPDSIITSLRHVIDLAKPNEETFQYYVIHFLNTYAKSKVMGMDEVFVYIAENYYATGEASWTPEENLQKIVEKAAKIKPLLIGKTAPNITCEVFDVAASMKLKDHENVHQRFKTTKSLALHDVDAEYTVLFIWAPDCGHCKKAMPKLIDFYEEYKSKGVEIYSVCSKFVNGIPECTEFMGKEENKGMLNWINVIDPYHKSKYKTKYDVESTPQVYVLDRNKEIALKRVGAEQLGEAIDQLIAIKAKQEQEE